MSEHQTGALQHGSKNSARRFHNNIKRICSRTVFELITRKKKKKCYKTYFFLLILFKCKEKEKKNWIRYKANAILLQYG